MYFSDIVEKYPNNIFINSESYKLSYLECDRLISNTVTWLKKKDIQEGDKVGILADNSAEYVITLLALFKIKAIAVLFNTKLAVTEIQKQFKYCKAKLVLTKGLYEKFEKVLKSTKIISIEEMLKFSNSEKENNLKIDKEARKDPSLIIFTSGSTNVPKACVLSENNLKISGKSLAGYYNLDENDVYFLSLPLFTVGALGAMYRALSVGGGVFVNKSLSTKSLISYIEKFNITCISLVPVQLKSVLNEVSIKNKSILEKLKLVLVGGAKVNLELMQMIKEFNLPVYVPYGMTELASSVTCGKLKIDNKVLKTGNYSSGPSAPHVKISVVDIDSKENLEPNKIGLIRISGESLFLGYLENNQSIKKIEVFEPGDLGTIDENNNLHLMGRADRMINSGGLKIFPEEIEDQLSKIININNVAVVSYEDSKWGMRPLAFIETNSERINLKTINETLGESLGVFKIPSKYIAKKKLPILGSEKIDYQALSSQTFKTNIFYRTFGDSSKPCLILLHGIFADGSDWIEVANALSDDFFVVLPDLPGFGNSCKNEFKEELSYELILEELDLLVEDLSPKKLFIGGYSFGSRIAVLFALNTKNKIDGLFLESFTPGILEEKERNKLLQKDQEIALGIENNKWEDFLHFWYSMPLFALNDCLELKKTIINKRITVEPAWATLTMKKFTQSLMPYMGNDLEKITCPVILVAGEKDRDFKLIAENVSSNFLNLKKIKLLNAGHNVHFERPKEIVTLIRELSL